MPALQTHKSQHLTLDFWTYSLSYGFDITNQGIHFGSFQWVDLVGGMTAFYNDTEWGNFTNVNNLSADTTPMLFIPMIETAAGDELFPPIAHPAAYATVNAVSPSDTLNHWENNNWFSLTDDGGDYGALRTRFILEAQTYMVEDGFGGIGMGGLKVIDDYELWDHSINFEQTWYMHNDGSMWLKVVITNEDNDHFNLSGQGGVIRFLLNPIADAAINHVAFNAGNGVSLSDGDAMNGSRWWGFYGTDVGPDPPPPDPNPIYDHNLLVAYTPSPDTLAATAIKYTTGTPYTSCSGIEFTYASPILTTGTSRTFYFRLIPGWKGALPYTNITTEAVFKTKGYEASQDYVTIDDFPAVPGANDSYFWTNGGTLDAGEVEDDYTGAGAAGSDSYTEPSGEYNTTAGSLTINLEDLNYSKTTLKQLFFMLHPNRGGGTSYTYYSLGTRIRDIVAGKRFMVAVNDIEDSDDADFWSNWELYTNHKVRYYSDYLDNYYEWNVPGYFDIPVHVYVLEDGNFEPIPHSLVATKDSLNGNYVELDFLLHDLPINYEYEDDPNYDYGHRAGVIHQDAPSDPVSITNQLSSEWVQYSGPYATQFEPSSGIWYDLPILDIDGTTKQLIDLQTSDGLGTAHWIKTDFSAMSTGWYRFRLRFEARGTVGLGGAITWYTARLSEYTEAEELFYWESTGQPEVTDITARYDLNEKSLISYALSHPAEENCSIVYGDLQWRTWGASPGEWNNAAIHSLSTTTNISSGPTGNPIQHNDLWWDDSTGGDYLLVDEDIDYQVRLRVKDQQNYYSDWVYSNIFRINLLPRLTMLSAVQDLVDSTYVNITYTIIDKGNDNCTLTYLPVSQGFYFNILTPTLVYPMTLEGTVSGISTTESGYTHSGDLRWNVVADLGTGITGTYMIGLVPYDSYPNEVLGFGLRTSVSIDTGIPMEPPYDLTAVASDYTNPFIRLDWKKGWEDTNENGTWELGETLVEQNNIYRSVGGSAFALWQANVYDNTGDDDISYIDHTVETGVQYCYRIQGIYDGISVGYSNIACATITSAPQEEDYVLSNIAGTHLPKESLIGVQLLKYEEFIDIIEATPPGIIRQPEVELKLGYIVPDDTIGLSAYSTRKLFKDSLVEIIDMTSAIIEDTDIQLSLPAKLLNPLKKYGSRALLTNVFFFDGTAKDLTRVNTLISEVGGGHMSETSLGYRELANRALFFKYQCQWEHSEAENKYMIPVNSSDLTRGYWYTGKEITVSDMPVGSKYLIKLTPGSYGWNITIYMNVFSQRFGARVQYNQITTEGAVRTKWQEKIVSIAALRRKNSADDDSWYYSILDGYIVFSNQATDDLYFVTDSPLASIGVTGIGLDTIKMPQWQTMKDQWHLEIASNQLTKSIAIRDLINVQWSNSRNEPILNGKIVPKNQRIGKIPIDAVLQLMNTHKYTVDTEVQLHYDFPEYDELINAQSANLDYGFVRIIDEQAEVISPGSLQVKHRPLAAPEVGRPFIYFYVYNTGIDGYTKYQLRFPGDTLDSDAQEITTWSIDYQNGVINIPKEYTTYTVSDIIYIDYTYREDYITYSGYTDYKYDTPIHWYVDLNPRTGHTMAWEGFNEPLTYIYGTDGRVWKMPGFDIYPDTVFISIQTDPDGDTPGTLTKVNDYTLDAIHGKITFGEAVDVSATSTVLASFVGRHVAPWILLYSTMFVYALPNRLTFHDEAGGVDIEFDLTDSLDEGCVRHTFDYRPFDISNEYQYDPSKILLGRIHMSLPVSMQNLSMLDVRDRGGQLDSTLHTWDKTPLDGRIISGNSVLIVVVPSEVTRMVNAGLISEEKVMEVASRHAAAGAHIILQYEEVENG